MNTTHSHETLLAFSNDPEEVVKLVGKLPQAQSPA